MLVSKQYRDFQILSPETGELLAELHGAQSVNRALPEDLVQLDSPISASLISRAPKKPLVGVLHLTGKYRYGLTSHGVPMYLCEPMNPGYPPFRVACKEKDLSQNLLISFQFESWEPPAELPRGSLLQILGPVEDSNAEFQALAILSCPWNAPRQDSIPPVVSNRPLLSNGTFNIDPPGCVDIDDVLTIEQKEPGLSYRIWITIADVAESVPPTSKAYQTAQKIASTTYQDGKAVRPMLHRDLSESALTLLPGQLRYGISLWFDFNLSNGSRTTPIFQPVVVQNQQSFTYESVLSADHLISTVLSRLTFSDDPHFWIEWCMLLYNREVANLLQKSGKGLLRSHDAPFQESLTRLQQIQTSLSLTGQTIPLEFLAYQSASYCPASTPLAHWGLRESVYCHSTSPLRRFADLYNQQILKEILNQSVTPIRDTQEKSLALALNRRQKEILRVERDFHLLKTIQTSAHFLEQGIFLWKSGEKSIFYIHAWKSTIRVRTSKECVPGQVYRIQYFADRRKASWKERIIYQLLDETSDEQNSGL